MNIVQLYLKEMWPQRQVLYITFGPTYVVLYRCILGELATIVIVICTVRTGCRLVLSGLLGIECLSVLLGIEA